ncbi:MAG: aldehyde dehydrogenase family protein [Candidatus Melainabacteria bacterium]|jgi:acyl-CoA reductase-like NAD-dependent aldehyde dehydrogenase|nr:aldehyde dehydrogenase family protein [Candidatus Melainabacteria bacterium]
MKMLKEIVKYPLSIQGLPESSYEYVEVRSPYSGEVVAAIGQADEKAIDMALEQAKKTFHSVMKSMPAYKRSEILNNASKLILENLEDLAKTISLEGGKPIKDARIEVSRASNTFAIAAREALSLDGEQLAMDNLPGNEARLAMVLREPVGVVAAVTPFNFPLNLVAHKLAPALAAGNTVVLKPSSNTPVSSFKLAALLAKAGLPEGALILTPCRGSKGNALVRDKRIAVLTFTGSQEVGWRLRGEVHPGVRVILELGGNAGIVVHSDADIEMAAKAACRGGYAHAGQICISVQRVYVQERIYEKFLSQFSSLVGALTVGDPLDEKTDVGPMIDTGSVEKTCQWVQDAVKAGAKLVHGGQQKGNNCLTPVILADTTSDMNVVCQEVFGPVVSVMKYDTIDDALALMNDSQYGLQAAVFSSNIDVAFKLARGIDAGGVIVNDTPSFRADHMPYGGRKESGLGLEGVRYALMEMTQPKFICLNLNNQVQ